MLKAVLSTLALLAGVSAIDCSAKELSPYNFESFKGIHHVTLITHTPPSVTNNTWYFGVCESINEDIDVCPKNSDICGVTSISLNKDVFVSEIVGFNSNLQKSYEPFEGEGDSKDESGIRITYENANWGDSLIDAQIRFVCGAKDAQNLDQFELRQWDGKELKVEFVSQGACITSDKDKDKNKKPSKHDDNGESWGWFTWIFIFLVLFLSIYIVGGAWFQYNKGNSIDFSTALREVLENFLELLRGVPGFVRELVEKVAGNGNRGEYSAV